jgi:hypothetical protein
MSITATPSNEAIAVAAVAFAAAVGGSSGGAGTTGSEAPPAQIRAASGMTGAQGYGRRRPTVGRASSATTSGPGWRTGTAYGAARTGTRTGAYQRTPA